MPIPKGHQQLSTNTAQKTTQGENEVASRVEAFFERVAQSGRQPRLRDITGIYEFDIAPLGSWCVRMKDGVAHVTRGPTAMPPRCVISCDAADFLDIISPQNDLNVMTALLQEVVTITGDFPFGFALLNGFTFPRSTTSRQIEG